MKKTISALLAASAITMLGGNVAQAQVEPFVGQIVPTAASFCPRGWAEANGQLLAISQNDALFSLYGTLYGGDGRTTFALPDLRGRMPMGQGNGPGLTPRTMGQRTGANTVTLTVNNLAAHNHSFNATSGPASQSSLVNAATATYTANSYATPTNITETLNMDSIGYSGQAATQSVNVQQPFLVTRYCVALFGIYPSRS